MAAGARRSRGELAAGFAKWLASREPGGTEPTVEVTRPSAGLSSETVFVSASWVEHTEEFVVRLPPAGALSFPDYDLEQQYQVQRAVAKAGIPVANPLAYVSDESYVGAPFLVMPRIEGRLLTTMPSYSQQGWLFEMPADAQGRFLGDFLNLFAEIHRVPVDSIDVGLSGGGPTLEGALDYWTEYVEWATEDDAAKAIYREGLSWLRERIPSSPAISLLWGDPQLPNVVFDTNGEAVAILDWEMASLGPAEMDLAWFLVLHELAVEMGGGNLPGFPDRRTMLDWYELALGRTVQDLGWYEVFANIRSGAIVLRIGQLMRDAGGSSSWTAHIPQPRQIRTLIGALDA